MVHYMYKIYCQAAYGIYRDPAELYERRVYERQSQAESEQGSDSVDQRPRVAATPHLVAVSNALGSMSHQPLKYYTHTAQMNTDL